MWTYLPWYIQSYAHVNSWLRFVPIHASIRTHRCRLLVQHLGERREALSRMQSNLHVVETLLKGRPLGTSGLVGVHDGDCHGVVWTAAESERCCSSVTSVVAHEADEKCPENTCPPRALAYDQRKATTSKNVAQIFLRGLRVAQGVRQMHKYGWWTHFQSKATTICEPTESRWPWPFRECLFWTDTFRRWQEGRRLTMAGRRSSRIACREAAKGCFWRMPAFISVIKLLISSCWKF